jgi:Carboxypeptidase regulatory-like domain
MTASSRLAVLGVALVLAGVFAAHAQTKQEKREAATERIVQGTVSDPDGKFIDGAVVKLKDMRTLQVRSFYTQKNGGYHFSGLKLDNDYELEATFNDLSSGWKRLSVFDTRKEPIINLKMEKVKPETKAEGKQ